MLVYHDKNRNRWIILTDNEHAWRAVEKNGEATTWARLPEPLDLTEDEIEELESHYDSLDFPRCYENTIREYIRAPMTNYCAEVFRQDDGKLIVYRADLGIVEEYPEKTDIYQELFNDYYQDELSEEASWKRRYLNWKEKIFLEARCLEEFQDWNGKS